MCVCVYVTCGRKCLVSIVTVSTGSFLKSYKSKEEKEYQAWQKEQLADGLLLRDFFRTNCAEGC